jgi:hypothetical protein
MANFRGKSTRRGTPVRHEDDVSEPQKDVFFRELSRQFEPSVKEAAVKAGITRRQVEHALKHDADFAQRFNAWKTSMLDGVEDQALRLALAGDGAMVRFILQAQRPEKYSQAAKKASPIDKIESIEDLKSLTDEELEQLQSECQG